MIYNYFFPQNYLLPICSEAGGLFTYRETHSVLWMELYCRYEKEKKKNVSIFNILDYIASAPVL